MRPAGAREKFLIIGCHRSGTTLLARLLSQHAEIYVSPETKYFSKVWGQRRVLRLLPRKYRIQAVIDSLVGEEYPRVDPLFSGLTGVFREILENEEDYIEAFFQMLDTMSSKRIIGEKTPSHTLLIRDIIDAAVPLRPKVLAICRDPRATVASLLNRGRFNLLGSHTGCLARWIVMNRALLDMERKLDADRYLRVRFEDLVVDPERTLEQVFRWLGVEAPHASLRPDYQNSSFTGEVSAGDGSIGFDRQVLDRWKDKVPPRVAVQISHCTRDLREALGYPLEEQKEARNLLFQMRVRIDVALLELVITSMRLGMYPLGSVAVSLWSRR